MLGAITGDIIGSVYEWHNIKTKDFVLFSPRCTFTDDSVMTLAVAEGMLEGGAEREASAEAIVRAMRKYGRMYPNAGYGGRFGAWLWAYEPQPYNSWGNGAAMRVASVGWMFEDLKTTEDFAAVSAAVTHDHPEGIKGAQTTAAAIYMARMGTDKADIKRYIADTYAYDLGRTLADIRPSYRFNESCQETVPEAIIAFLESTDFEDAIRCAVSLGGDSDTLAAITGSIAEAAYGIPDAIAQKALSLLDAPLQEVYRRWSAAYGRR